MDFVEQRTEPLIDHGYDPERANILAVLLIAVLTILAMATAIVGFVELSRRLGWL